MRLLALADLDAFLKLLSCDVHPGVVDAFAVQLDGALLDQRADFALGLFDPA